MFDFSSKKFQGKVLAIVAVPAVSLMIFAPALTQAWEIKNPLGENASTIPALIDRVAHFFFLVGVAIAPVMILLGAFYFMTAAGNPDRVTKAKKIIMWALVGVAILYMSDILISVIRNALGVAD